MPEWAVGITAPSTSLGMGEQSSIRPLSLGQVAPRGDRPRIELILPKNLRCEEWSVRGHASSNFRGFSSLGPGSEAAACKTFIRVRFLPMPQGFLAVPNRGRTSEDGKACSPSFSLNHLSLVQTMCRRA
jgi:hypothetical protein